MTDISAKVVSQIDAILASYDAVRRGSAWDDVSDASSIVSGELLARISATIDRLAPPGSQYRVNAAATIKQYGTTNANAIPFLVGALRGLRADYVAGYHQRVEQLVEADLFADFLDMAEHLLAQGYKDPSAVLVGGVLEEHLRRLCVRNSIPASSGSKPKKADTMNADLAGGGVYSGLDQKSVTGWLDLRNKAAHGRYTEYSAAQVNLMLNGVQDFMRRVP